LSDRLNDHRLDSHGGLRGVRDNAAPKAKQTSNLLSVN
jgi:hypothetical protein